MSTCETYLDDITAAYGEAAYWLGLCQSDITWLKNNYSTSSFNLNWRTAVALSIARIEDAVSNLTYGNWQFQLPYRLPYYLANCIEAEEYDLTWQKIVEAWVANDFEGRAMTVAVIDRMRQILWDEPFSIQWAARPEQQEL